jgi:hypothetical protein
LIFPFVSTCRLESGGILSLVCHRGMGYSPSCHHRTEG